MPTKLLRLLALVVLVLAGCSSPRVSKATATTTTTGRPPSTTAPAVASGSPGSPPTTTPPTTSTTARAGGPLPTGFTVTDLTWISDSQGWALGTAPCAQPPCTSVVHTVDGGRTWAGLPAPRAYLDFDPNGPPCSATVACVHGIRFASASTGYAFGGSSLWLTTDGGHSWSLRGTTPTDALEVRPGAVVRVTHPDIGCPPGCPYQVQATTVGSTTWHGLSSPPVIGISALLAVNGSDLYVAARGHTAGGAQDAHTQFARSTDGGAHWELPSDPCGVTPSGNEADAYAISAGPGGYLAVGCNPRANGEAAFVVVSTDAATTFGPHRGGLLPTVTPPGQIVTALAAPTGPRLVVVVIANGAYNIVVTNDSGADWSVTHSEPMAGNGNVNNVVGFEDTTTGRAVLSPRTILTTTDGGGHWMPFSFP